MMDKDGDGNISADDLKQVMSQLGVNLGKEDVEEMIKAPPSAADSDCWCSAL